MNADRHAASTFWSAAQIARNGNIDPQRRRRGIGLLIALAQRNDMIGDQARAVLQMLTPVLPRETLSSNNGRST